MYEFQVDRLTKELTEDMKQYKDEGLAEAIITPKTSQFKTIPIESSLTPEHNVATYDDVRQIVMDTKGAIAVFNCICKQEKPVEGDPCKKTERQETCIGFNETAEYYIDMGMGRSISRDECLEILKQNEKNGLVIMPENAQKPNFICSCCSCCCGLLDCMKKFPRPAEYWHSNYFARVDAELCERCKKCQKRCQMEAISIEDKISTVNLDRCIGCGLCVSTCKPKAITLEKKAKEIVPPKDEDSMYKKITMERFGTFDKLKMMGKMITGGKI
jgi:Pyruvate/2-oxoacid:ferredoxin oxidoreductase delta subunit